MMKISSSKARMLSRLGACGAYGIALNDAAERSENLVALTADLRFFSGLERFASNYPERFFNVGISEQDMIGVSGGLAKEGFVPFASTYGTFASMRVADQVRVCMGYMGLPIKLVGLTSGLSVGILGPTHIALEDIAVMRSIPGIAVVSPADCTETYKAILACAEYDGPMYIRLTGTQNMPVVYSQDYDFEIGTAIQLKQGKDVALIATGSMVNTALEVEGILSEKGIVCSVFDMHTIRPMDCAAVDEAAETKCIVTIEEHGIAGGLGGAVAEYLASRPNAPKQLIIGCDGGYKHAGSYEHLLNEYGLVPTAISEKIVDALNA